MYTLNYICITFISTICGFSKQLHSTCNQSITRFHCEKKNMYSTKAIAKKVQNGKFKVITIERGWTSENDIDIEIKFCGFSPFNDVHYANYDWGYKPGVLNVAGHEIAGIVSKVGENVKARLNISFFSNYFLFQIKVLMENS